jgi:hypothetical protein
VTGVLLRKHLVKTAHSLGQALEEKGRRRGERERDRGESRSRRVRDREGVERRSCSMMVFFTDKFNKV